MLNVIRPAGGRRGNNGFQFGLLGRQLVKVGIGLGVFSIDLIKAFTGGKYLTQAFFHRFTHGMLGVQLGFLRQVANIQARHGNGFAFNLLVNPGHNFKQG